MKTGNSLALLTALLAAAALPVVGRAQDAGGWSLPPAPATQAPTQQGPVDNDHPIITPAQPSPNPSARPTASQPPARQPPQQDPTPTRPSSTPVPQTSAPRATASGAAAAPPPGNRARDESRPARAGPAATPAAPEEWYPAPDPVVTAAPRPAPQGPGWLAWWWVVPAGLLALVAALLVAAGIFSARRRRAIADADADAGEPLPPVMNAAPSVNPAPPPPVAAAPLPASAPPPLPAAGMASLDIAPGKLRLSLVYATLPVRIAATTDDPDPRAPFTVHADLACARAGQSAQDQLAPPLAELAPLGRIGPGLPAITAEVRLPLAGIEPLRQGGVNAFVPLLRLAFVSADGTLVARRAFAVGPPGATGGIQPIRLDLGPRDIADVTMRAIPMPDTARPSANFALDPAHAAG